MQQKDGKKILWHTLVSMALSAVQGSGNVVSGFSKYGGLKAIVSWILMFAIYFVSYALTVGELGSTFKYTGDGVSSWIYETIGPKMAYYTGWTYQVAHTPYISQKPSSTVITASWALFQDKRVSGVNTTVVQTLCLVIFLFAMCLSGKEMGVLKRLATLAGPAASIMSMLSVVITVAAPVLTGGALLAIDWSPSSFVPDFNANSLLGLPILVFAVGGCEKISPYVNKMKDPSRDFAKGAVALATVVVVTAILDTIALGMTLGSNRIPQDPMTNGAYYAFQELGEYYHTGNFFMVVYAPTNLVRQFSVMVLSVDAPLRIPLDSTDSRFTPGEMFEKSGHGIYMNGRRLVMLVACVLIVVPAFDIRNVDALVCWLAKVNSVYMPLQYLWIFVVYIALKRVGDAFCGKYRFVKGKTVGILVDDWRFLPTALACLVGTYSEGPFQLVLNIVTPFVLAGLGFIMPWMTARGERG